MAFFGLTNLGYQYPIGDKMIVNPRGKLYSQDVGINSQEALCPSLEEKQGSLKCTETRQLNHLPARSSTDIHHGSHERYKEMVKRLQTPRAPNQLYVTPLTDSQQYGWMSSKCPEPWTEVRRFPRKNSEMTKFVKEMSLADREFILF
nr:testis-expressed protein 49 [Labrus bergylta]